MSLSSNIPLGALRIRAQQRSDLENTQRVTTSEWNQYLSDSYKELYDLLVSAYGDAYFVQTPYSLTIGGAQLYSLPTDCYKLLGVDMQYGASPTGWVTLKRIEFLSRNQYSWLTPLPISAGIARLWYVPEPTPLQFVQACITTSSSTTITLTDSADIIAGMNVYGANVPAGTTVSSVNTLNSTAIISAAATVTSTASILFFWTDATTLDGISGWEEYVIIDAAIKAATKEESESIDELVAQKKMIKDRIESMSQGRDIGQAHHVTDAMQINTPIVTTGATNMKYCLLGNQIMFVPAGYDDSDGNYMGGGY